MTALREAIRAVYDQVAAPDWAAPNLDGLADVLRDLSWLPAGEVVVRMPVVDGAAGVHGACGGGSDDRRLQAVLERAVTETADGPHPVVLVADGPHPVVPD